VGYATYVVETSAVSYTICTYSRFPENESVFFKKKKEKRKKNCSVKEI
jgi:hypothetical protein